MGMTDEKNAAIRMAIQDGFDQAMAKTRSTRPKKTEQQKQGIYVPEEILDSVERVAAERLKKLYTEKNLNTEAYALDMFESEKAERLKIVEAEVARRVRQAELEGVGMVDVEAIERTVRSLEGEKQEAADQMERKILAESALRMRYGPTGKPEPGRTILYVPPDLSGQLDMKPPAPKRSPPPRQPLPLVRGRKVYAIKKKNG